MSYTTKPARKRMNFMISMSIVENLEKLVPAGERSDFVNEVLEESLVRCSRKKAIELMNQSLKKDKHKEMTDEELIKEIRYGRKYDDL